MCILEIAYQNNNCTRQYYGKCNLIINLVNLCQFNSNLFSGTINLSSGHEDLLSCIRKNTNISCFNCVLTFERATWMRHIVLKFVLIYFRIDSMIVLSVWYFQYIFIRNMHILEVSTVTMSLSEQNDICAHATLI